MKNLANMRNKKVTFSNSPVKKQQEESTDVILNRITSGNGIK